MDKRALDRITAFTDAAVAIALTLLVLPLVDIAHGGSGPVSALLREHDDDIIAFLLSFFVIMAFWRGHRRLYDRLAGVDETLLSLNVLWLLGIVFLPVPTAVLTFEGDSQRAAAVLYLLNLLFVALMNAGMVGWISLHPRLLDPERTSPMRHHLRRSVVLCGVIGIVTLLAIPFGPTALILLAALPVGQAIGERLDRRLGRDRSG
ncbi:MAG TPA: TMEM175 family protein [Microlunatus sp.]|nr:TMEM175 family protein [Microlunatus sp.]